MPLNITLAALTILVALCSVCRGSGASAEGRMDPPSAQGGIPAGRGPLAPVRDWRLAPLSAASRPQSDLPDALRAKRDGRIDLPAKDVNIAVQLPPTESETMLTFEPSAPTWRCRAETSDDSTDGADGTWVQLAAGEHVREQGCRLWKVELPAGPTSRWLRVTLSADEPFAVANIGLYSLDPQRPNDYWVVLGASIQAQSIRNEVFKQLVAERYGYDPVIFNTGVGGWQTQDVRDALPRILAEHPHARFVAVHIGGNNVSLNRPYPGGADAISDDLVAILDAIEAAGKVPILSRLSYRAYGGDNPVPPEEHGSGPYVTAIFDPLIRERCPLFFDFEAGRGIVDAYGWFKAHPEELAEDGVHVNEAGQMSWNRLWADRAGEVIYAPSACGREP